MKITKTKEHVLFTNENGEYHLSHDDFTKLGESAAIELAANEIDKKLKSEYKNDTIDFDQARDLGFCEYGIKDFCNKLELDIDQKYSIKELFNKLTLEVFIEYSSECSKLFSKKAVVNKFGGAKKILQDNQNEKVLNFILLGGFIPDKKLHLLACDFAEESLSNFEKKYPDDNRPRRAIEVKRLWIEEEFKNEVV